MLSHQIFATLPCKQPQWLPASTSWAPCPLCHAHDPPLLLPACVETGRALWRLLKRQHEPLAEGVPFTAAAGRQQGKKRGRQAGCPASEPEARRLQAKVPALLCCLLRCALQQACCMGSAACLLFSGHHSQALLLVVVVEAGVSCVVVLITHKMAHFRPPVTRI